MSNALPVAFLSMPGGYEWLIIGLVALLLFGKRLPGVARSLGQALHEFKTGLNSGIEGGEEGKSEAGKKDLAKTPGDKMAKSESASQENDQSPS